MNDRSNRAQSTPDARAAEFSARELAERAGVTVRTIHYYAGEGLLPAPVGTTRAASYTPAHLARLRLIAALRDEGLSLAAIRARLAPLRDDQALEVAAALERHLASGEQAPLSTLGLLEAAVATQVVADAAAAPPAGQRPPSAPAAFSAVSASPPARRPADSARDYLERVLRREQTAPPPLAPVTKPRPAPRSETWRHFPLADGVDLRVREDRYQQAKGRWTAVVDAARAALGRHGLTDPPNDDADPSRRA